MMSADLDLAEQLLKAIQEENVSKAEQLLLFGANPNLLLPDGATAFHIAVGLESDLALEFTKLLLQFEADPNVRSTEGITPLHVSAIWGKYGCLQLLVQNGGDPHIVDQDAMSVFDYSREYQQANCLAYLEEYSRWSEDDDEEESARCSPQTYAKRILQNFQCSSSESGSSCGDSRRNSDVNSNRSGETSPSSPPGLLLDTSASKPKCSWNTSGRVSCGQYLAPDWPTSESPKRTHSVDRGGRISSAFSDRLSSGTQTTVPESPEFKDSGELSLGEGKLPSLKCSSHVLQPARLSVVQEDVKNITPRRNVHIPTRLRQSFYTQSVQEMLEDFDKDTQYFDVTSPDHPQILGRSDKRLSQGSSSFNKTLSSDDSLFHSAEDDETTFAKLASSQPMGGGASSESRTVVHYSDYRPGSAPASPKGGSSGSEGSDSFHSVDEGTSEKEIQNGEISDKQKVADVSVSSNVSMKSPGVVGSSVGSVWKRFSTMKLDSSDSTPKNSRDSPTQTINRHLDLNPRSTGGGCLSKNSNDRIQVHDLSDMFTSDNESEVDNQPNRYSKWMRGEKLPPRLSYGGNIKAGIDRQMQVLQLSPPISQVPKSALNLAEVGHRYMSEPKCSSRRTSDESLFSEVSVPASVISVSSDGSSVVEILHTDPEEGVSFIEQLLPVEPFPSALSDLSDGCPSNQSSRNEEESDASSNGTIYYEYHIGSGGDADKLVNKPVTSKRRLSDASSQATIIYDWKSYSSVSGSTESAADEYCIPEKLKCLTNSELRDKLVSCGDLPGPITLSTRHVYVKRLNRLYADPSTQKLTCGRSAGGHLPQLAQALQGQLDISQAASLEHLMSEPFSNANPNRKWREGTTKASFNYILMDPRVTQNLPYRNKNLGDEETFGVFIAAVFYIGKGKKSRPYAHLYEALKALNNPTAKISNKVQHILDIWGDGLGVVVLHCFQNVIPVEAYTREACMVEVIGLPSLTNVKKGDYYGIASTWPAAKKRLLGVYLLHKAMKIFIMEGERQIKPHDIKIGQ